MGNKARGCGREPNIARGEVDSRPHLSALFPVVQEQTRCFQLL